ncbi:hypothetical protein KUV75_09485 [Qipengyuania gaetbuli]|uniref:hypothetical protein n=1 Tax=Qipengyuania gaetbuli TaxID=266952 RepID=UPI001C99185D|nr:hypothetical protein [Qipengyuania gaetbuli]MBY6015129.1 hypothetical protein [Qipengyuania gaetbuli]
MRTIELNCFLGDVRARKAQLGFDESAEAVDARRNNGVRRTASKRRVLAQIAERAEAAGVEALPASY